MPIKTPKISDAKFDELKALINTTIHELVFVCHYLDDDDVDSALDCLCTAQCNLDNLGQTLTKPSA